MIIKTGTTLTETNDHQDCAEIADGEEVTYHATGGNKLSVITSSRYIMTIEASVLRTKHGLLIRCPYEELFKNNPEYVILSESCRIIETAPVRNGSPQRAE